MCTPDVQVLVNKFINNFEQSLSFTETENILQELRHLGLSTVEGAIEIFRAYVNFIRNLQSKYDGFEYNMLSQRSYACTKYEKCDHLSREFYTRKNDGGKSFKIAKEVHSSHEEQNSLIRNRLTAGALEVPDPDENSTTKDINDKLNIIESKLEEFKKKAMEEAQLKDERDRLKLIYEKERQEYSSMKFHSMKSGLRFGQDAFKANLPRHGILNETTSEGKMNASNNDSTGYTSKKNSTIDDYEKQYNDLLNEYNELCEKDPEKDFMLEEKQKLLDDLRAIEQEDIDDEEKYKRVASAFEKLNKIHKMELKHIIDSDDNESENSECEENFESKSPANVSKNVKNVRIDDIENKNGNHEKPKNTTKNTLDDEVKILKPLTSIADSDDESDPGNDSDDEQSDSSGNEGDDSDDEVNNGKTASASRNDIIRNLNLENNMMIFTEEEMLKTTESIDSLEREMTRKYEMDQSAYVQANNEPDDIEYIDNQICSDMFVSCFLP